MTDAPYIEIGQRLKAIREGFSDLSQKDWAAKHGFSVTQYNNWEKGTRRITVDDAERLADTYGLDLDFIYRGRRSGLSERASNVV
ncbi:helix-turn-helix domain-containing protein [Pseudooceanicola sp. C21-150M6]